MNVKDPCQTTPAPPGEDFSGDSFGLDNDGDLLYDGDDPDCAANQPPEAVDDAYTTDEDTPLNVVAPGVLGNDTDADGDLLTASLVLDVTNGVLSLNADGSFTYTPNLNFFGTDVFTYVANDGTADSAVATVMITVNGVNDPPVADPNGPYFGTMGIPLPFDGSGSSDVDGNGTIATYVWDFGDGGTGTGVNPSHTYTAAGTYTVSLTVTDTGGLTDTATTTADISAVNQPPVAVNDAYTTDEDTPLNVVAPGVLANDNDADGDPLTAALVTDVSNGVLSLNADGSFSYTPAQDFNVTDSFTYVANDGTADSNVATVTITMNAVNDPPVAVDDTASTPFETLVDIDVLANDMDVDGDVLTVDSFDATSANGGTVSCDTAATTPTPQCTYTPPAGFFGNDTFDYTATDGILVSDLATVTVTVNPAVVVDLDIAQFQVTKRVSLRRPKEIGIKLVVKNNGTANSQTRSAMVVGVQGATTVYSQTMPVSDAVGDGRTRFNFPSCTPDGTLCPGGTDPVVAGDDITWTATIADDDPDRDVATANTRVVQ